MSQAGKQPPIASRLSSLSAVIRDRQRDARRIETLRHTAIREAVASGMSHAEISRATGLTRARIGQIVSRQHLETHRR